MEKCTVEQQSRLVMAESTIEFYIQMMDWCHQQDPNIMLSLELSLAASGVYQGPQSPHTGRKATLNTRPSLPECSSLLVVP